MEMDKRQKRMLILLGVVLSYAAFELITNSEQYFGYYFKSETSVEADKTADQAAVQTQVIQPKGITKYDKDWGEDPFFIKSAVKKQKTAKSTPQIRLTLSAISFGGGKPVAMINNEILGVGEQIEGYRIKSIEQTRVTLVKGTEQRVLTLD